MFGGSLGTISTMADWQDAMLLTDEETGDPLDLTGCSITFKVRWRDQDCDRDYGFWWGSAGNTNSGAVIMGSTDGGQVTIPDLGTFQWAFPAPLTQLRSGEHDVGILIARDGSTIQLFLGTVVVEAGI